MRIQRPPARRNYLPFIGCGCLGVGIGVMLVAGIVILLVIPALPGLALQFSGFKTKGNTETVFQNVPSVPTVAVQNPTVPQEAVINLGSLGSQTIQISPTQTQYEIVVGTGNNGAPLARVSFTETGLMDMCYQ